MSESQVLFQVWSGQNRLVEVLDNAHQSIETLSQQIQTNPSHPFEKNTKKFSQFQKHLFKELEKFTALFQKGIFAQLEIQPHLKLIATKVQEMQKALFVHTHLFTREEWESTLFFHSQKIAELKKELQALNLKSATSHESDKIFIDHVDSLGVHQVIQWPRKIFHIVSALFIVWVYLFSRGSYYTKLTILGSVTLYFIIMDWVRLTVPWWNARVVRDMKNMMRKKEVDRFSSMTFYLFSIFLVCWIFPKGIAVLAILYLGIGDALASIVGIKWGRHKMSRRFSLEGSLAFFATCFLITLLYPLIDPSFSGNVWALAALGGLIGMTSEWISDRIDDNFVIPLYSAFFLWLFVGHI